MPQNHKYTAKQTALHEYTQQINEHMFVTHGYLHLSPEDRTTSVWRAKIPYSPEIEQDIIEFTQSFLHAFINNRSNYRNPQFMQCLINDIADFLSKFVANNPKFDKRKHATKFLAQTLTSHNAISKPAQQTSKAQRKKENRKQARETHRQVSGLFDEAQREFRFYRKR